ncbi:MAG: PilN domain-containing protein [Candidatus Zixiibacteriota bacterium]
MKVTVVDRRKREFKVVISLESPISEAGTFLGDFLKNQSVDIDEIRVSGALDSTFHKIFVLPDMKGKMLRSALEAEVTKAFGNNYQFKLQDLGGVPVPGNRVNRKLLTAGIKKASLEELSARFAGTRLKSRLFTSYPVAVQRLLEEMEVLTDEPLGFMELDHPKSRITMFKGKEIRLTREVDTLEQSKDPDRLALAMEIYRTILFYNDTYPEERVGRLVFAGSSATPEMVEDLKRKTGAEIIPFAPEKIFRGIDQSAFVHPGCLGLALLDPSRLSFGFTPISLEQRRKTKRVVTLSFSVFLGFLLILGSIISKLSFDLKSLTLYQGGLKGEIKQKEDRLRELGPEIVAHSIETSQPSWPEILMEQAAVVPQGVTLQTFSLKKTKNRWCGEISGLAEGSDEITSLLLLEEMQDNLVRSPFFSEVRVAKRELQGTQVTFKIVYQLNI